MNPVLGGIVWLYRAMLRLYPLSFRAEFAEEMAAVFVSSLGDAAQCGPRAVLALCTRELSEYPINLIREHWSVRKEIPMRSSHSALWGAIGFGLAATMIAISSILWRGFGFSAYLIAGAIGGALFALGGRSRSRIRSYALIGTIAFGMSYWFVRLPVASPTVNPAAIGTGIDVARVMISMLLEPAIFGMAFGALIGLTQRNWGWGKRLAVWGFFGFGIVGRVVGLLCVIPYWGIAQAINSYQPGFTGRPDEWVTAGLPVMIRYGSTVIAAIIGGAILGHYANKERPAPALAQPA